jgi:hypothetical protein
VTSLIIHALLTAAGMVGTWLWAIGLTQDPGKAAAVAGIVFLIGLLDFTQRLRRGDYDN